MELLPYTRKDYDEAIEFLSRLYRLDRGRPYWLPGRWEYATYLCSPLFQEHGYPDWIEFIRIVRDRNSIVGLVNSENPDHNVFIHTHPHHRHLESELLAWAEKSFTTEIVSVWTLTDDADRIAMLDARGYIREEKHDYLNWCELDEHEPVATAPDYQRQGLGLAILSEAMRRLKERNIKRAYVGSSVDWRRAFYRKAGFTRSVVCNPWTRRRSYANRS